MTVFINIDSNLSKLVYLVGPEWLCEICPPEIVKTFQIFVIVVMNEIMDTLSFIKGVTSQWYEHLYPCTKAFKDGEPIMKNGKNKNGAQPAVDQARLDFIAKAKETLGWILDSPQRGGVAGNSG